MMKTKKLSSSMWMVMWALLAGALVAGVGSRTAALDAVHGATLEEATPQEVILEDAPTADAPVDGASSDAVPAQDRHQGGCDAVATQCCTPQGLCVGLRERLCIGQPCNWYGPHGDHWQGTAR